MFEEHPFGKVVNTLNKLDPRKMTPEEWNAYKEWALSIQEALFASIPNAKPLAQKSVSFRNFKILYNDGFWGDCSYGESTLSKSGCALFCIEQAKRRNNVSDFPICDLAYAAGKLGYYEPGKGTYHHLIDRLGGIRLNNAQLIFDAIFYGDSITVLLEGHYVNLVGIRNGNFVVEDCRYKETQYVPFNEIFSKMKIAWKWKYQ